MSGRQPPNYAGTVKHHGLSDRDMEKECPDEVIDALAQNMPGDWRTLPLGLPAGVVDDIDKDRNASEERKRQKLLHEWKQKFGYAATCARLARCLIDSGRVALAGLVCKTLKTVLESRDTQEHEGEAHRLISLSNS